MDRAIKEKISVCDSVLELIDIAGNKYGSDVMDRYLYDGKICLDNIRFCGEAYEPIVDVKQVNEIDRLCSMFAGPFFTSENYPWPKNLVGDLAVPLIQLKLNDLPNNELDISDLGVLQVWNLGGSKNWLIRLIRFEEFSDALISPLPNFINNRVTEIYGEREMQWLKYGAAVIQGFERPFFSCAFNEIFLEDDAPDELGKIKNLLSQIELDTRDSQLFGTFSLVQYDHDEVGLPLLISMTDGINGVFGFGAGGTGQIFVNKIDGETSFIIDSAC